MSCCVVVYIKYFTPICVSFLISADCKIDTAHLPLGVVHLSAPFGFLLLRLRLVHKHPPQQGQQRSHHHYQAAIQ